MSTIDVTCVCGKNLRFRSEFAGRKSKCPECGAPITVPDTEMDELEEYEEQADVIKRPTSVRTGRSVTGKRVIAQWGQFVPAMFGRTTLEVVDGSLVENTQSWLTRKHLELLLTKIDSAEIRIQPNPAILGAAIVLIPVLLVGLLVLPFYFFVKNKFLIFHSGNNVTALVISGDEEAYRDFMHFVLTAAQKAKRQA